MSYFRHALACCETDNIGERTRVWVGAHVMTGAVVGDDCNICDGVLIETNAVVGNRVTIKKGAVIGDGVTVEDDVFVGNNVVITNDRTPRSKIYREIARTVIGRGASIGVNATIIGGNAIGEYAMIGAGAVVTHDVKPYELVVGSPARHLGWVDRDGRRLHERPEYDELDGCAWR